MRVGAALVAVAAPLLAVCGQQQAPSDWETISGGATWNDVTRGTGPGPPGVVCAALHVALSTVNSRSMVVLYGH